MFQQIADVGDVLLKEFKMSAYQGLDRLFTAEENVEIKSSQIGTTPGLLFKA